MMEAKKHQEYKEEIVKRLQDGQSLCEISYAMFGQRNTAKINTLINSYGLHPDQYSNRYLYMNREWLKQAIEKLGSINKISEVYNMPRVSVTRYAQRFGLYTPKFSRSAKNVINENYFENINDANKAYWLGFAMADGCMYHFQDNKRKEFSIKLQSDDYKHLVSLAQEISFPVDKIKIFSTTRYGVEYQSAQLKTGNLTFCNHLEKQGILPNKSGRETFPSINSYLKPDFIRGFWDGDGTVTAQKISVCSTSLAMICSLSSWLCHTAIHYSIKYESNVIVILISRKSYVQFLDVVYYPGCFALQRKLDNANEIRSTFSAMKNVNEG